jgi:DNA-binding response OmpR family regulator
MRAILRSTTCALVSLLLRGAGFLVTEADTAAEALALAESDSFDLYVLDHGLPDSSGVELCRELRRLDDRTPVLFFSGYAMSSERAEAMGAGADGYLVKPDDIARVAAHAARLVAARRG